MFPSPSWLASLFCTNQVFSTVPGIFGRNDTPTHKLDKNLEHVDYTIWWGCSNYIHRLSYPTNRCEHHQNKGSSIHQLLRRRNCCHGTCFSVDFHKRQLCPDFHIHLYVQSITTWGTLIMQPSKHFHSSILIIHFIIHLYTVGARTLKHPWQWPHRKSSKRSNHN